MIKDRQKTVVLSAGGTGGHLFPAEALAAELLKRGIKPVIFTDKRGHIFQSLGEDVVIHTLRSGYFKPGLPGKISAVFLIITGLVQAVSLLLEYKPSLVIGFGGYPSFPGVLAAQILRIPTIVHEQNAVLGKANLWLSKLVKHIAVSFSGTRGIPSAAEAKTVLTGNPVRSDILAVRQAPYLPPSDKIRLFITGGSQAAKIFSDLIPDALVLLPDDIKKRLKVVHQCREADIGIAKNKYQKADLHAEIRPFFSDMGEQLKSCHLFIGRSGATTVAEIAVAGRPAVFVPLLHADMQQKLNADTLAAKGGAWIIMQDQLTPDLLAKKIQELIQNPAQLAGTARICHSEGKPEAVQKLADLVQKYI